MIDKRVLIVEDEEISRNILNEMLVSNGYKVTPAANGKVALNQFMQNPYPVIITDIDMPEMDGNEFIAYLKEIDDEPIIIVQTVHDEVPIVIDTMKKGVYDYIIKPINANDILMKLDRAFEIANLRRMQRVLDKEKLIKLESQLSWLKWNEGFIRRDYDRIDRALFKNLHTSFNQGAGFGALLTLVNIISSSSIKDGDKYVIDSQLFDMINDSAKFAERTIDTFSKINNIINNEFNFKRISLTEFYKFLQEINKDASQYSTVKQQNIIVSEKKINYTDKFIKVDYNYFRIALFELIINAFKFSKKNTDIIVIMDIDNKNFILSIINTPTENDRGVEGIPLEYENMIFEPFFRMFNGVFENFDTIDYGLGLTIVQKIIEKHNGTISASNIKDFSDVSQEPVIKVIFSITIPLAYE